MQNFEKLKLDVDENNVTNIYSMAYSLKITKLKSDIERHIVEQFLNPENCCSFYLEAIRVNILFLNINTECVFQFDSKYLLEKSKAMIVHQYEEIAQSKNGTEFLNELPFQQFLELIEDPELNVTEEI